MAPHAPWIGDFHERLSRLELLAEMRRDQLPINANAMSLLGGSGLVHRALESGPLRSRIRLNLEVIEP